MKKHVDQFKPGQSIPHCHLKAKVTSDHEVSPPELLHKVKLVGAKDPFKFITLNLVLQQTLPGQNQLLCVIPLNSQFMVFVPNDTFI